MDYKRSPLQGWCRLRRLSRGVSRILAAKLELFVTLVNNFQQLTFVTKNFILDIAAVLDPRLNSFLKIMLKMKKLMLLFTLMYPFVLCGAVSSVPSNCVCSNVLFFHTTPCHKIKDDLAYLS